MEITLKTTGLLGRYLPAGSSRNKGVVELPDNSSVKQLLKQLGIPDDGRCYVTFNGTLLPTAQWHTTLISSDDAIVLMAPIAAG